jgi:hypothetical protein
MHVELDVAAFDPVKFMKSLFERRPLLLQAQGLQAHRNALRQTRWNYFSALCLVAAVAFWL